MISSHRFAYFRYVVAETSRASEERSPWRPVTLDHMTISSRRSLENFNGSSPLIVSNMDIPMVA